MTHRVTRSVIIAGLILRVSGFAQQPDLSQLKERVQQLEQMMKDLQREIAEAEGAQNTPAPAFAVCGSAS